MVYSLCRARLQELYKIQIAPYDIWEKESSDNCTGGMSDARTIICSSSKVARVVEKHDLKLKGIGYDPHNADGFCMSL